MEPGYFMQQPTHEDAPMNIQALLETPIGRTMVAELESEMAAETLARRLEVAAELAAREAAVAKAGAEAAERVTQARADVSKKNEEARAAQAELYRVQQAAHAIPSRDSRKIEQLKKELRRGAAHYVRATADWIDEEIETTTNLVPRHVTEAGGVGNDGAYRLATHNTEASINARLTYLRDARRYDLPEIALLPDPADVAAACDEIREKVPEIKMQKLVHRRVV